MRPAGTGTARAVILVPLLAGGLLAGCARDSTAIGSPPLCDAGGGEAGNAVILMAQSVPSATQIPCIRAALPLGWKFHHLIATDQSARFWLDSDRDGQQAIEVSLTESCDTGAATEVPSDREGMRRLERVDRLDPAYAGSRYYLFDGGCLTVAFSLDGTDAGEALALASQVVGVVSRDDLREQVRRDSGGRLSLDPGPEGGG